jgi:branched-chain amino acid transport system ATP-binding protein
MTSALLAIEKLEVVYQRAITAVQGITLAVEAGQIVALLGTNGAGKSTTLRAISGFLGLDDARVTEGAISFKGTRIENRPPHENTRRGIVLVPERDKVFPNLTVAENLIAPVPRGTSLAEHRRREALVYQFFPRLGELKTRIGGLLSGGERQMLALGRALMAKPKLLVLDEPSLGLAPLIVREIFRTIASLRSLGVSVLLVEQNARAALETADYGYVLETGEIIQSGPADTLIHDPKLINAYLGGH